MGNYQCSDCGYGMDYQGETANGEKYKCRKCGKMGKVKGMKENRGPIDASAFGL
jgi:DNA-directed RNA polymerase subunit RPC12/RpoP